MGGNDDYDWVSDAAQTEEENDNSSKLNKGDSVRSPNQQDSSNQTTNQRSQNRSNSQSGSNSISKAAMNVKNRKNIQSGVAQKLFNVLSDPSSTQHDIENNLEKIVESLENNSKISNTINELNKSSNVQQLNSTREELIHLNSETANSVGNLLEILIDLKENAEENIEGKKKYEELIQETSNCVTENCQRVYRETEPSDILQEFNEAVQTEDIFIITKENSIKPTIEEIEEEINIETREAEMLANSLKNPSGAKNKNNIKTSIQTIEELSDIKDSVEDITQKDIERRLESIKSDLKLKDIPIYRHLEDRIRELEAMISNIDSVQKYAIYQEITFYDRTLIPRLSRSTTTNDISDIDEEISYIENRINAIKQEYVSVRADHNHTIPNHFIELSENLSAQSRQMSNNNPEVAAGILSSSDDLLDYIEDLYEKNEYSVMLRQLRG